MTTKAKPDESEQHNFTRQAVDELLTDVYSTALQSLGQPLSENIEAVEVAEFEVEELCPICFSSGLEAEPCVTLACGHTYHLNCVRQLLDHRWSTLRISFSFMKCPSCKQDIQATELET